LIIFHIVAEGRLWIELDGGGELCVDGDGIAVIPHG